MQHKTNEKSFTILMLKKYTLIYLAGSFLSEKSIEISKLFLTPPGTNFAY